MYRVIVHKRVYLDAAQQKFVLLRREVELSFVPFVGLSLAHGSWAADPTRRVDFAREVLLFTIEAFDDALVGFTNHSYLLGNETDELFAKWTAA